MFVNTNFQCIKIHHINPTTLQRNAYSINHFTLMHHISCVQKWIILFYCVLLWCYSLMMVPRGPKHLRMLSVILQCNYRRNQFVYAVCLGSSICKSGINYMWNTRNIIQCYSEFRVMMNHDFVNCTVSTAYPGRGFQKLSLLHPHKVQESNIPVSPQSFLYMFWYIFYTKQRYKTIVFISLPSEFHISYKRHVVWTAKMPLNTHKVLSTC